MRTKLKQIPSSFVMLETSGVEYTIELTGKEIIHELKSDNDADSSTETCEDNRVPSKHIVCNR